MKNFIFLLVWLLLTSTSSLGFFSQTQKIPLLGVGEFQLPDQFTAVKSSDLGANAYVVYDSKKVRQYFLQVDLVSKKSAHSNLESDLTAICNKGLFSGKTKSIRQNSVCESTIPTKNLKNKSNAILLRTLRKYSDQHNLILSIYAQDDRNLKQHLDKTLTNFLTSSQKAKSNARVPAAEGNEISSTKNSIEQSFSKLQKDAVISASLGVSRNGPVTTGIKKVCPFKPSHETVDGVIQMTKASLQRLQNEESKCPQVQSQLLYAQNLLDKLNDMKMNENRTDRNNEIVNCRNYKEIYENDYNFIMSQIERKAAKDAWVPTNSSVYTRCMELEKNSEDVRNLAVSQCVSDVYKKQINDKIVYCENNSANFSIDKKQEQIGKILGQFSTAITGLVKSGGLCNDNEKLSHIFLQSGLDAMTVIKSLSSNYVAGVGIVLSGQIFSTLLSEFFNKDQPSKLISKIDSEYEYDDLNCALFYLQQEQLDCDELKGNYKLLVEKPVQETEASVCQFPCNGGDILNFFNNIIGIIELNDEALKKHEEFNRIKLRRSTYMNKLFSAIIPTPDNPQGELVYKYIKRISQNPNYSDLSLIGLKQILELVQLHESIDSELKNPNITSDQMIQLNEKYIDKILSIQNSGEDLSSNLRGLVTKNFYDKNKSGELYNLILKYNSEIIYRNITSQLSATDMGDASSKSRKLDVAMSAFITGFQSKFEDRIKALDENWESNKAKQTNQKQFEDAFPIAQMCFLNSGIFYYNKSRNSSEKVQMNIKASNPDTIQDICSKFSCIVPTFAPEKYSETQRPQQLRSYLCSMYPKYSEASHTLRENILKTGKVCPDKAK